jgi:hypothetical protein
MRGRVGYSARFEILSKIQDFFSISDNVPDRIKFFGPIRDSP